MKLNDYDDVRDILWMIYVLKTCHDKGIDYPLKSNAPCEINRDYLYEISYEALDCVTDYADSESKYHKKYGVDDETYIFIHENNAIAKYCTIARKLHRLEGCQGEENKYIQDIYRKMHNLLTFDSYNFDYFLGNMRKRPQLEILTWCEFYAYPALFIWVIRVMDLFKEELPSLQEKYRQIRRMKRCAKKSRSGGVICAA